MNTNLDMSNVMQRAVDRMFKKVDNVVWDLMSGEVGIRNNNPKSTTSGSIFVRGPVVLDEAASEADFDIKELLFDNFTMPIPAFAQITPRDQIKLGDMVVMGSGQLAWVCKINAKSYTVRKTDGQTSTWTPTKVETIGLPTTDGIMVVRSLMQTSGSEAGLQTMQSSLMPLLMMGGDSSSMEQVIPMMLMMQTSGGAGANMGGMMQTMMMMSMMKGMKSPFSK